MDKDQSTEGSARSGLGLQAAPFLHSRSSTPKLMLITSISLLPAVGACAWFQGAGVLWQLVISAATLALCELICALLRRRGALTFLMDYSWVVTALLLALSLPPLIPWQYGVAAALFAGLLVKHAFGGLGMNIFNPAMAGFIFMLISAPQLMFTCFVNPVPAALQVATPQSCAAVIFDGADPGELNAQLKVLRQHSDALSGATYLESVKTARKAGTAHQLLQPDFIEGDMRAYVWIAGAYLCGGLLLMATGIIFKRMVFAFFVAFAGFAWLGWHLWPQIFLPPEAQLLLGGTMLAGFYIITDPVTNAGTARGRIVFVILVALLIVVMRGLGSYSDSVAFAVLLGNAMAPLIDVLTRRRTFGMRLRRHEES